jgi:hypothetical protein|tara:strand:+ start:474 stop:788 length:315 start_codon:yes stop_codon:yes gene_type:complete
MNLILLNSIQKPSTFLNKGKFKKPDFDKFKAKFQEKEQRKMDNLKQTISFVKNIGDKDVAYFKSIHNDLVEEFKKKDSIEQENDDEDISLNISLKKNKEDIFDN